ncbi:MAG: L-seryl-tRNA(Sec) selenium transferase [Pirellulales bacterium]
MSAKKRSSTSPDPNPFRALPSVNEVVDSPALARWMEHLPRAVLVAAARDVLADCRREMTRTNGRPDTSLAQLVGRVEAQLEQSAQPALDEVINATGILIHTGLGRAPLSAAALSAIAHAAAGYTALEMDLATGERGKRVDAVRGQLCTLTGAESATVVNNNAAALVITLGTLAAGKQVIVARGELIEIGGSFRLPEVMAASGAHLREVGTTNKTRIADYAGAVTDQTGALLKVHPSNYRITGFTQSASIGELAALGKKHELPVIHDIGSGALFDLADVGLGDEPVARDSIDAGADLVLFSGDKLLGGPQAGVIVGRRRYVEPIECNPLMRALRVDKLTLAALAATLAALAHPQRAAAELPLWRMITTSVPELNERAEAIARELRSRAPGASAEVVSTTAYVGGGSLPNQGLESVAIAVKSRKLSDERLARRLRAATPPVVARLQGGRLMIDLRAVLPRQDESLVAALAEAIGK